MLVLGMCNWKHDSQACWGSMDLVLFVSESSSASGKEQSAGK